MTSTDPAVDAIKARFDETFEHWKAEIPRDAIAQRRPGSLRQEGGSGSVRYAFGEDDHGIYLEFYAFHRIWGDHHARIHADGRKENLDTLQTVRIVHDDPDEDRRAEERMHEANRKLLAELEEAGLQSGGPVPGSFTINAYLVTDKRDLDKGTDEDDD